SAASRFPRKCRPWKSRSFVSAALWVQVEVEDMSVAPASPSLDRSIGLGRVLFQSITTMAPAARVVLGLGLVMLYIGKAAPFAMFLGAVAAVCIAVVIGQFAR